MVRKLVNIGVLKRNITPIFSFLHLGFIQGVNALIQILIFPIIAHIIGLTGLGPVALAASYAALVSILVNFGSNQSGVKEVAVHRHDPVSMSETFYCIYFTRLFFFVLSLAVTVVLRIAFPDNLYTGYFLLANAVILAETLNPLFFFVGIQKLLLYNIVNLLSKLASALLIIFLIRSAADAAWVNFWLGITGVVGNGLLCVYVIFRFRLYHYRLRFSVIIAYIKKNFFLTGNNLSVQLQQSFFLFALSATGNAMVLGAYSLCDKIVWSFRLLIISFFNAVYPKAVLLFSEAPERWKNFRTKLNILLLVVFSIVAALLVIFADYVVLLILKEHSPLAAPYLRAICLVPLVAALNSINVIDLLMRDRYQSIFIVALILLAIAIIASKLFLHFGSESSYGYYPFVVEVCSLPLYRYFIARAGRVRGSL